MGISLLTALQIQGNSVLAGSSQHENGKFSCLIMHGEEKRFRILLSSTPTYETAEEAKKAGQTTIDEIKRMDLSPQKEELKTLIPEETQEVISDIIDASRSPLP